MSDPIKLELVLNIRQDLESFQELFVQPLEEAFEISELGEVTGHELTVDQGTGEPLAGAISMRVPELVDKQVAGLITLLEQFGAPLGSHLTVDRDGEMARHELGKVRGIALYLDGVNLDKKVYKKYDFDSAWDAMNNELGEDGMACGFWEGRTETAIYAYGLDPQRMKDNIARLLQKHPLFRGARVISLPSSDEVAS